MEERQEHPIRWSTDMVEGRTEWLRTPSFSEPAPLFFLKLEDAGTMATIWGF